MKNRNCLLIKISNPSKAKLFFVAILIISIVFSTSCYTTPRESRGKLSDAMEKAKDGNHDREIKSEQGRFWNDDYYDRNDNRQNTEHETPIFTNPLDIEVLFGINYALSPFNTENIERIYESNVLVNFASPSLELLFGIGIKIISIDPNSELYLSVKDGMGIIDFDMSFRYLPFTTGYSLEKVSFFQPWIGGGIGFHAMGWNYKNSFIIDGELIETDTLTGVFPHLSIGIYPVRYKNFGLTLFAEARTFLFDEVTVEGFENDYFSPIASLVFGAEVFFGFN